jgi:hypothetical protein
MSSYAPVSLNVALSVAAGDAVKVNPRSPLTFGIVGTFTATLKIQWSPDESGSVWYDLGADVTAALTAVRTLQAGRAKRVRINTTAYTSGTPVATVLADTAKDRFLVEREFSLETLAAAASVAAGAALDVEDGEQCFISVSGTWVATIQPQISLSASGTDWYNFGEALTAGGTVRIPRGRARRVRLNTSAYTSGTPAATLLRGFAAETVGADDNLKAFQRNTGRLMDDYLAPETVASGALSVLKKFSNVTVDATKAYTLANGLYVGQEKWVYVSAATSTPNGTLTPASMANGTSIDLDAINEVWGGVWDGTSWNTIGLVGATITP